MNRDGRAGGPSLRTRKVSSMNEDGEELPKLR